MIGGSSSINGMVYVRGHPNVYDRWGLMGNEGWNWKDMRHCFLKAEGNTIPEQMANTAYHNTSGPIKISLNSYTTSVLSAYLKSGEMNGYAVTGVNAANQTGVARHSFTIVNGSRCASYVAYLSPAYKKKNLVVITDALVTKILTNSNKQAVGVIFKRNGIEHKALASKEVILSAGTIGSPKLLLLSGIGPTQQLKKHNISVVADLPGVGENLHDHIGSMALIWKLNCTNCSYTLNDIISVNNLQQYVLKRTGPYTIYGGVEGVGYIKTKYANQSDEPDIELELLTFSILSLSDSYYSTIGLSPQKADQYFGIYKNETTFNIIVWNVQPKSRGTVTLTSKDPCAPPNIDFKYFSNPDDMMVLVEAMKEVIKIGSSPPLKALGAQLNPVVIEGCENFTQFSSEYLECMARHFSFIGYHIVGSCQMGPSNNTMAVVSPTLEVYHMSKLRIIDCSVMPQVPNGNTNAAVVAVAEKGAQMIKNKYNL